VGQELTAVLVALASTTTAVVVVLLRVRARRSTLLSVRIGAAIAAALALVPLLPLAVGAALLAVLVSSDSFTDLGTTRSGAHLVIGEVSWHHTAATVYEQEGIFLHRLFFFDVKPFEPFAHGDYRMFDDGATVALVWGRTENGGAWSDSVVVPVPTG
jgi:hypothetical protein